MKEGKREVDQKIKELDALLGEGGVGTLGDTQLPVTSVNGITIIGCASANSKTGLCKTCSRGFALDVLDENGEGKSCLWCGVKSCGTCEIRKSDGKAICNECVDGEKPVVDKDGKQSCFCEIFMREFYGIFGVFIGFFFVK